MKTVEEIQQVLRDWMPESLVVPAHTDEGHFYNHTGVGETYASVTTKGSILNAPHLKKWAARMAVEHMTTVYCDASAKNVVLDMEALESVGKAAILAHQDQFEEAGSIGTWGHDIVDEYLKEWIKTKKQPKDIKTFVKTQDSRLFAITRSAELFCNDFHFIPIASEVRVASIKRKFGGTLDALGMVAKIVKKGTPNCSSHNLFSYWHRSSTKWWKIECRTCGEQRDYVFALVDWKTANSIDKPEYAMQVSAYRAAIMEMTGLKINYIFIVRLDKVQAKYEVMQVVKPHKAYAAFLGASKIYDWLHNKEDKLTPLVRKERIDMYG